MCGNELLHSLFNHRNIRYPTREIKVSHEREPVPHTCPEIDKIILAIDKAQKLCENLKGEDEEGLLSRLCDIEWELGGLDDMLEDLREANDALRTWGITEAKEVDDLRQELSTVEKELVP